MNSQIIIRWSQGHATSNSNKYKLNRYVPQQMYRLGTVSNKLLISLVKLKVLRIYSVNHLFKVNIIDIE